MYSISVDKPWFTINLWSSGAILVALFIICPILTIISFVFVPSNDVWQHLAATVLDDYIRNSLLLVLGVVILSLILGVGCAWLTSVCEFPGRKILAWALLLPMAAPAYIIAISYAELLDPAGPIQRLLRSQFGWTVQDYWFPDIRSLPGAGFILSLVLYPYVYLLARAAFLAQSVCVLEISRSLGCSPWRTFITVALPLARPAIVVGLILVAMETLADYGTVSFFGVPTLTTGIFRTWFGLGDTAAAAQLATVLLAFIAVLVVLERLSRGAAKYHHTSSKYSSLPRYTLTNWRAAGALAMCLTPLLLGFIVPVTQLLRGAVIHSAQWLNGDFLTLVWNSLWLAVVTASIALSVAVFLSYAQRLHPTPAVIIPARFAALGYAMPGTVIAVGVVILSGAMDHQLQRLLNSCCDSSGGLIISGGFVALISAYLVRFLSVSQQSVEAGLSKIKPSMDEAAAVLGHRPGAIVRRVHLPLLRGTLLTAALLVFVDVLKELPVTLVMRPFNVNTLAVRAYELASEERLLEASSAGLAIVLAGILPVIILSHAIGRARPGKTG